MAKSINKKSAGEGKKQVMKILIPVAAVLAVVLIAFTASGVYAAGLDTVFPNVSLSGIPVGEMNREEAKNAIAAGNVTFADEMEVTVVLTDEVAVLTTGKDAGFAETLDDAADLVLNYGHEGNFFSNTIKYIGCIFRETDLSAYSTENFDEEGIKTQIAEAAAKVDHKSMEASYKVNEKNIIITKGTTGYTVPQDEVYDFIYNAFSAEDKKSIETTQFSQSELAGDEDKALDLKTIYDQLFVEPKNSEYDKEKNEPTDGVTGVSFDLNAAKRAYDNADPGDKISIDLILTEPEITKEMVKALLFRDCLATKTTTMYSSSYNRLNNITLASAAINGLVLNPGEEFSFNGTVGERTSAKGYKSAGAYVGGETVEQIGGGICQVSSTIYYCVLKSDLEVTDRSCHMFSVAYLPLGMDATVNWGTVDFCFKNDQDYPVRIDAEVVDRELTVSIWGTKLDDSYIELDYKLINTIPYEEIEKEDESIPEGETKIKTSGHLGYVADCYKYHYDGNGNLIEVEYVDRSTYKKQDRVILIPPKKEEPDPNPNPEDPLNPNPIDPTPTDPTPVDPIPVDPPVTPDPSTPTQ